MGIVTVLAYWVSQIDVDDVCNKKSNGRETLSTVSATKALVDIRQETLAKPLFYHHKVLRQTREVGHNYQDIPLIIDSNTYSIQFLHLKVGSITCYAIGNFTN